MSVWKENPLLPVQAAKLWERGLSSRQIAEKLGHGITRMAVVGILNRMRKKDGEKAVRAEKPVQKAFALRAYGPSTNKTRTPSKPVLVVDNSGLAPIGPENEFPGSTGCLYIHGDPGMGGDWRACGHPRRPGKPYCPEHCSRTYVPSRSKAEGEA